MIVKQMVQIINRRLSKDRCAHFISCFCMCVWRQQIYGDKKNVVIVVTIAASYLSVYFYFHFLLFFVCRCVPSTHLYMPKVMRYLQILKEKSKKKSKKSLRHEKTRKIRECLQISNFKKQRKHKSYIYIESDLQRWGILIELKILQ